MTPTEREQAAWALLRRLRIFYVYNGEVKRGPCRTLPPGGTFAPEARALFQQAVRAYYLNDHRLLGTPNDLLTIH